MKWNVITVLVFSVLVTQSSGTLCLFIDCFWWAHIHFETPSPAQIGIAIPKVTTSSPTTAVSSTTSTMPALTTPPAFSPTVRRYSATAGLILDLMCFSCSGVSSDGACDNVALCKPGEVCSVFHDPKGFNHRCLNADVCSKAKALMHDIGCWECCTGSLCNRKCAKDACVDTANCMILKSTGYSVCGDPTIASKECRKTCNHC